MSFMSFHELTGLAGAPQKVGKACLSSMASFHAASSAASRASSVSPSRRSSALSATSHSSGASSEGASGQWGSSYAPWQLQTDLFRGHGNGNGGLFGGGGHGGSGRPGFGGSSNNSFPGDGPSAQQFMFVGLKPDHASSFMGAVWRLLSVVCMMQTFGFLLYGDYAGGADIWQDECFDTVEI